MEIEGIRRGRHQTTGEETLPPIEDRPGMQGIPVGQEKQVRQPTDGSWPMLQETLRTIPAGVADMYSGAYGLGAALVGGIAGLIYDTGDREFIQHATDMTGPDSMAPANGLYSDPREQIIADTITEDIKSKGAAHMKAWEEQDEQRSGFLENFDVANTEAFEFLNQGAEALNTSLHPKQSNLEQLSDAQLATLGVTRTAAAIGIPVGGVAGGVVKGVRAGIQAAKMGKLLSTIGGAARAAPGAMKKGAWDATTLLSTGAIGGAAVGAAVTDPESREPAGRLAEYTSGAGAGSLVGTGVGIGARMVVDRFNELSRKAIKNRAAVQKEAMESVTHWTDDLGTARKNLGDVDMTEVPLGFGVRGDSVLGRAMRHGAQEMGEGEQIEYNRLLMGSKNLLKEKQDAMSRGFKSDMGTAPEPVGSARRVTVDDQADAMESLVGTARSRMNAASRELQQNYETIGRSFRDINVQGFEGKFVTKDIHDKIEHWSQVGDRLEASILGEIVPSATSQTTDVMQAKGGVGRFMKAIEEYKARGMTEDGLPGDVVTNLVHNANEVMRRAESSGDPAHQMRAKQVVDYAYGLLDELTDQGIFPRALVNKFKGNQGLMKEHYQTFYSGNAISEALKNQKNWDKFQVAAKLKPFMMTKGGNLNDANIMAMYKTTGDEAAVNDFIVNTVNTKYESITDLLGFYEKNKFVIGSRSFDDLSRRFDDLAFDKMGIQLGDKGGGLLDFVRGMPDHQVKKFTELVINNGTDAYRYMGFRVLDEIADLPLAERVRYLTRNQGKLEKIMSTTTGDTAELAGAMERLKTFTAMEEVFTSHRPFDIAEPVGAVGKSVSYLGKKWRNMTGMGGVATASVGRAMFRRILSVTTAIAGLMVPRALRQYSLAYAQKYFMQTLGKEMIRDELLEKAMLETVVTGQINKEVHAFIKNMVYNFSQSAYQPARFTQERMDEISGEQDAEARRLLGIQ